MKIWMEIVQNLDLFCPKTHLFMFSSTKNVILFQKNTFSWTFRRRRPLRDEVKKVSGQKIAGLILSGQICLRWALFWGVGPEKLAPWFHPSFWKTVLVTKVVAVRAIEILLAGKVIKVSCRCRFWGQIDHSSRTFYFVATFRVDKKLFFEFSLCVR